MSKLTRSLIRAALFATVPVYGLVPPAASALSLDDTVALEARGFVDLDSFLGPEPELSNLIETETEEPFVRSSVSVADEQTGLYSYTGSADIGNLELKVEGMLTNSDTTDLFGRGVPLMQVVAEARDIVTLTTDNTDPYEVTLEMTIEGDLALGTSTSGITPASANALISLDTEGQINVTDGATYSTSGPILDTLSVTYPVSGPEVTLTISTLLSFTVLALGAGQTTLVDLGNTALIELIVPEGVSVSSASGTFGVPITPVPEPTAAALMASGLLLLGGAVARRQRQQQTRLG